PVFQVRLVGSKELQLSRRDGGVNSQTAGSHPLQVLTMKTRLDDGNDVFPRLEPLLQEGVQDPVLLVSRVVERADVLGSRPAVSAQRDDTVRRDHGALPPHLS